MSKLHRPSRDLVNMQTLLSLYGLEEKLKVHVRYVGRAVGAGRIEKS